MSLYFFISILKFCYYLPVSRVFVVDAVNYGFVALEWLIERIFGTSNMDNNGGNKLKLLFYRSFFNIKILVCRFM